MDFKVAIISATLMALAGISTAGCATKCDMAADTRATKCETCGFQNSTTCPSADSAPASCTAAEGDRQECLANCFQLAACFVLVEEAENPPSDAQKKQYTDCTTACPK